MKILTHVVMATVCLFMSSASIALTEFRDGETHVVDYKIDDDVWIDYQTPNAQTTISLVNYAYIPFTLRGYNNSKISIYGYWINYLDILDNSYATINNGYVGSLNATDNSQVLINNGTMDNLSISANSRLAMKGGRIYNSFVSSGNSFAILTSGGTLYTTISGNSNIIINGGWSSYSFHTTDLSHTIINDGLLGYVIARDNSQITISGGLIDILLAAANNSRITLSGSNFTVDGNPVGFREIKSIFGKTYDSEPYRILSGTLANGNTINSQFQIGQNALINLVPVPEPSSLLALISGIATLGFLKRRKSR
ncbi:MAG: PEP-CTERM sorting domain-containing protein [Patescibacteria group bacterium]|nr:PEP-CTERM sorting domain-containing protein [Patescibacteria group bacterium]